MAEKDPLLSLLILANELGGTDGELITDAVTLIGERYQCADAIIGGLKSMLKHLYVMGDMAEGVNYNGQPIAEKIAAVLGAEDADELRRAVQ